MTPGERRSWRPSWEKQPDPPMRGLGDVVERVAAKVGIKPCGGCKERKALLNRIVPFAGTETPKES